MLSFHPQLKARLTQLSFTVDLEVANTAQPDHHKGSAQSTRATSPREAFAFAEMVSLDVFDCTPSERNDSSLHSSRCIEMNNLSEEQGGHFDTDASSFGGNPSNSTTTSEKAAHYGLQIRARLNSAISDTTVTDSELSCEADLASNMSQF